MARRTFRIAVSFLGCWIVGVSAGSAQQSPWYEGVLNPEAKASAFKSCDYLVHGGRKPEIETVLWLVDVGADPDRFADYFVMFADGGKVQIETTTRKELRTFDVRISDPKAPRRRFIHLTVRAPEGPAECRGDLVSVFSAPDGEFVSCMKDATSPSVTFNRTFLLAHADQEWLDDLARVVIAYGRDRQFKMAQLGFLEPIFDPDKTVVLSTTVPERSPCRYADVRSQFEAGFRPRDAIAQAYRGALKSVKP